MDMHELINLEKMLEDLLDYDPFFDRFYNDKANDDSADFYDALRDVAHLEKINRNNFRDYNYNNLIKLIEFIYGENEQARKMAEVISIVHEKILRDYLNIPYLDKLVSETYFEYEWEMHSRLDAEKSKIDFYRDHYFHQIRNLYEIYKFFEVKSPAESLLADKIIDGFWVGDSNTARYCKEIYYAAKRYYLGNIVYRKIFVKLSEGKKNVEEYFERFVKTYIIKGALYVAALVHDIGYPIGKQIERNRRFSRFLSNTAFNKGVFEFENIRNIIESSLLFSIVGTEEIKKNLEKKLDHGILSAIVLLVHYYEHGAIHNLSPIKRAIIEFAAIIIYDHTADYKLVESRFDKDWKKEEYREYSPCFAKNPISLIFRFVDDIQEWDRTYFETAHYSDIRICAKCKKPILKQKLNSHINENEKKHFLLYNEDIDGQFCLDGEKVKKSNFIYSEFTKYMHKCGCDLRLPSQWQGNYEINYGVYKHQLLFHNKKINYVIACNRIYYFFENNTFKVLIDYNPFKLLELLRLSNDGNPVNFHAHRYVEIEKLKEIIKQSRMDINDDNFMFKISAYIQCHPYLLKRKIIFDFLASLYCVKTYCKEERDGRPIQNKSDYVSTKIHYDFYEMFKFDFSKLKSKINNDILKSIKFYLVKRKDLQEYFPYRLIEKCKADNTSVNELSKLIGHLIYGDLDDTRVQRITDWLDFYLLREDIMKIGEKAPIKNLCIADKGENANIYADKIKEKFSYLTDIIDPDRYSGHDVDYNNMANINETDLFYNDFYILGIMNDFTEMVKNKGFDSETNKN